jgi:hypothetical protein
VGGVPTLQVEGWLACNWVDDARVDHVHDVVLLDVVERLTAV